MLSVPPPKSDRGGTGTVEITIATVLMIFCRLMWLRSKLLGSFKRSCVMVPAAMKLVRSCGILNVSVLLAVWLGKGINFGGFDPVTNGVMSTGDITGGPSIVAKVP